MAHNCQSVRRSMLHESCFKHHSECPNIPHLAASLKSCHARFEFAQVGDAFFLVYDAVDKFTHMRLRTRTDWNRQYLIKFMQSLYGLSAGLPDHIRFTYKSELLVLFSLGRQRTSENGVRGSLLPSLLPTFAHYEFMKLSEVSTID